MHITILKYYILLVLKVLMFQGRSIKYINIFLNQVMLFMINVIFCNSCVYSSFSYTFLKLISI